MFLPLTDRAAWRHGDALLTPVVGRGQGSPQCQQTSRTTGCQAVVPVGRIMTCTIGSSRSWPRNFGDFRVGHTSGSDPECSLDERRVVIRVEDAVFALGNDSPAEFDRRHYRR